MERARLAPDLEISRILTGLWQVADMEHGGHILDAATAAVAMGPYVEAGYSTFDMADHYGSAELIVGEYISRHGGDTIQALTKWVPKPGPAKRDDVRAAVELALERLRLDSLDLLQFHAWSYPDPAWLDCLFYLQELQSEGLIRHLGLTNFDTAHLRMVLTSGIGVVSNQVSHSLVDRRASGAMSELCREHDVKLLAYGTLAGGLLSERYLGVEEPRVDELETWSKRKYKRFIEVSGGWDAFQGLLQTLSGVAARHEVSIPHVATRWVLDNPVVGGVIVGARLGESEYIDENLKVFDLVFDDQDRERIDEALEGMGLTPGDCGDEYRKPPFLTAAGDLSDHFDDFPPPYEVIEEDDGRLRTVSGVPWEDWVAYSRGVRKGERIVVTGTTASHGERLIGGSDAYSQAQFAIDKIEGTTECSSPTSTTGKRSPKRTASASPTSAPHALWLRPA
jgi:aryl-alcohol dehydrogenase-like predicted oxidoreductase